MLRLLAALGVLVLSASALAGPLPPQSRWSISSLQRVYEVSVAGRSESGLFATLNDATLRRSLDGGKTWSPVAAPGGGVHAFVGLRSHVGSPHDSRTWYVYAFQGEFVTRDAGNTWSPVVVGVPRLAFGATPNLLYTVPLTGGFNPPPKSGLISVDGGVTWRSMATVPERLQVWEVVPALGDARVVYLWGSNGVARSNDQGQTWQEVTPPMSVSVSPLRAFAVDAIDPDIVYANTFQALDRATYTSRDGGRTWTRVPLEWIVNTVPDPAVRGRAYAFSFNATVYETRDGGLTWAVVEGAQLPGVNPTNSGPPWMNVTSTNYPYKLSSVAVVGGRRVGITTGYGTLASVDLHEGALAIGSDLWWNPAAPGTGLTITQHSSNQVFMVWYTYDATGKQLWRVMPGGKWSDRAMTGALYETDGPPYFRGAFDTSRVKLNPVGTATIEFSDHNNATLVHANGAAVVQSRTPISRMQFGDLTKVQPENYADIWYNASESGWGLGISQQGDRIFATWYVYGDDGEPMWVIMPDAVMQTEFVGVVARQAAQGDIYTTRGNPRGGYTSTKVGTARIMFREPNGADLEYTAFGRSSTVQVTRIPF